MCLDESSRSLQADVTSSSCFSSWPESDAHKHVQQALHFSIDMKESYFVKKIVVQRVLTSDLLLEEVNLAL